MVRASCSLCSVTAAGYVVQYMPSLAKLVLMKIGPRRAQALKGGGSGYDLKLFRQQEK